MTGLRVLLGDADARVVVGLLTMRMLMIGAADVLFVLLALEALGMGAPGAAILNAALGAGTIVGGIITFGFVGRSRLSTVAAGGAVIWGTALAATDPPRTAAVGDRPDRGRRGRPGRRRRRRPDDPAAVDPRRGPGARVRPAGRPRDGWPGARLAAGPDPGGRHGPDVATLDLRRPPAGHGRACRGPASPRSTPGPWSRRAPSRCCARRPSSPRCRRRRWRPSPGGRSG